MQFKLVLGVHISVGHDCPVIPQLFEAKFDFFATLFFGRFNYLCLMKFIKPT